MKSLSIRDAGRVRKTHDQLELLKVLDLEIPAEIVGQGKQAGIAVPKFLKQHSNVFVSWFVT